VNTTCGLHRRNTTLSRSTAGPDPTYLATYRADSHICICPMRPKLHTLLHVPVANLHHPTASPRSSRREQRSGAGSRQLPSIRVTIPTAELKTKGCRLNETGSIVGRRHDGVTELAESNFVVWRLPDTLKNGTYSTPP